MSFYKAYIDGSFRKDCCGIGFVVIKDDEIFAKCRKKYPIKRSSSNHHTEWAALEDLLKFIVSENLKGVTIYTDSKYVMEKFENVLSNGGFGKKLKGIDSIVSNHNITLKQVYRDDNPMAHDLAYEASSGEYPYMLEVNRNSEGGD